MLKPVEMRKARIFALRTIVPELVASLHREGVIEIQKGDFKGLDEGRPLEFFNVVSEQLVRMRAINAMIGKYYDNKNAGEKILYGGQEAVKRARALSKLDDSLKILSSEANAKESEITKQKNQIAVIDKLLPFTGIDFSKLETKTVSFRIGEFKSEKFAHLKEMFDKELGVYNLLTPEKSKTSLLIFRKSDKQYDAVLANAGFIQIELPQGTTTPAKSKRALENAQTNAQDRAKDIHEELSAIAQSNLKEIQDVIYSLEVEADRAEIASKFGFSKSASVFEGWVMKKDFERLSKIVSRFGNNASLSDVHFGHHEEPPVVLKNPKIASPFEWVTKSYSLPNYYEMDPSLIYLIFIPILLGMIVGDVIYGFLTIFLSMWLMKKFAKSYSMSNVTKIWFYTGFTTIVFGLLFDEWCGFHHKELLGLISEWGIPVPVEEFYIGLSRLHQLPLLIGLTILVGLVHLAIGFTLGAINEWKHSKKHAAAKIAWIGIEIGGTLAVAAMVMNLIPADFGIIGIALFLASSIALAFTEGMIGVIEIPGLMGNVLSYARIAVIGVVGVVLAEIINEFFAPKPSMGIFLIVAIPLFVIFHMINTFIAIFEALIQGGRLNLIEFRMKFLKGGGKEFLPFALKAEKGPDAGQSGVSEPIESYSQKNVKQNE